MTNKIKEESKSILASTWIASVIENEIKNSIISTIKETISENVREALNQKKFQMMIKRVCKDIITGNFENHNANE